MYKIKIGCHAEHGTPIFCDISTTGHFCIAGGTGSGKSMLVLYLLYGILKNFSSVKLFIGDFKRSGDYTGISENYAVSDGVVGLIEEFYNEFENTTENNQTVKILLIDEYAGFITWLTQQDKKKCEEIKGKVSSLLMLSRARKCFVACIQQRMSANLFPAGIGAIDNFQVSIGMGSLSVDSRKSLFAGEHLINREFEDSYKPATGQGLILIDGQPLLPLTVPYLSDKEKLKRLLRKLASDK